ncbi:MAG TPA: hypothetical protein PKE45_05545 [Caldilineaceae bacterium]|nr:hypothetical protein [Caldilineaceae bacterium]
MTTGSDHTKITHRSYQELLLAFPPRTINTEADYAAVQHELDRLVDIGELTVDEQEYLDLLGTLVWAYEAGAEEKQNYALRGVDLVKGLIELYGLKLNDLTPIFKTKSIASAVLNGRRRLTVDQINKLATFFNLPHALFFEPVAMPHDLQDMLSGSD